MILNDYKWRCIAGKTLGNYTWGLCFITTFGYKRVVYSKCKENIVICYLSLYIYIFIINNLYYTMGVSGNGVPKNDTLNRENHDELSNCAVPLMLNL